MSEATTVETPVATPKAKPAKKPVAKKPSAPKKDLRKPQYRILKALSKAGKGMTRAQIAEKAPVDTASCVEYLGSHDAAVRKANDAKHFPSLITLGMVKAEEQEEGAVTYTITAKGRETAKNAPKE